MVVGAVITDEDFRLKHRKTSLRKVEEKQKQNTYILRLSPPTKSTTVLAKILGNQKLVEHSVPFQPLTTSTFHSNFKRNFVHLYSDCLHQHGHGQGRKAGGKAESTQWPCGLMVPSLVACLPSAQMAAIAYCLPCGRIYPASIESMKLRNLCGCFQFATTLIPSINFINKKDVNYSRNPDSLQYKSE